MKRLLMPIITAITLIASTADAARTDDPQAYLKENFWGKLYKDGGKTLYCEKPFKGKSLLIDESYIYSDAWIRDHLMCGTPRQCREHSKQYRNLITDMHNIYPAQTRFELKRKNAKFEDLDDTAPTGKCGEKRTFLIIDPPNRIKGEIARALLYMYTTYNLPLIGTLNQLKAWSKLDPVSDEEKRRNALIKEIQGNENPFISNPEKVDKL